MDNKTLPITPKTRVGELLDAYPSLEPVLLSMSPAFEKLRNPVLRKTVARVATLQQVSVVGGLNTDKLIRRLRQEAGQEISDSETEAGTAPEASPPDWLDRSKISMTFDATPVINSGGSPMQEILRLATRLKPGEIMELKAPFTPAPVSDMLVSKGYRTCSVVNNPGVSTYISKPD